MLERLPRYRTGDADLDRRLVDLLDAAGATANRDQLFEIMAAAVRLARDGTDRLDLKITNAALRELRRAFQVFADYRSVPKLTIFGSARTLPDDPLYEQARRLATLVASAGWMVVTGGGPGIMAAGTEGAGRERSFGINIRLPFEQEANEILAGDPKLIEMRYFFTRKLMLVKESEGFVALPGGFGTLDEALELLVLAQTGKAEPVPIVLLDVPSEGGYWEAWERFVTDEVASRGMISPADRHLYRVTADAKEAADEILGFYRNYQSRRWVGDVLLLRLRHAPTPARLGELAEEFADICLDGTLQVVEPMPVEVAEGDHLELARLAVPFDLVSYGRLRQLIDALNRLPGLPPTATPPRRP
ncbi:MAG TPA: TIGR00730 family Rossman fold protein [Acidimicrobiales bacterium]|nr:TIGR00730 family Rossman fold protein [Acidimicrobiales bacterium]